MLKHWTVIALLLAGGCATVEERPSGPMASPWVGQAIPSLSGSYHRVRPGETLWRIARLYGLHPNELAAANRIGAGGGLKAGQQLFIPLPKESGQFAWPVIGRVASSGGSKGIRITAAPGSLVRASRSGRVAVATRHLSGWGRTVIIDHFDGYLSVYAAMDQILVAPGSSVRQGLPVGKLGPDPLHFEIRQGTRAKSAMALLPATE